MVQQKILKFEDEEQELIFVNISIPVALLFLSSAVQVGFVSVTQAAYQDERIFPFSQRASAINVVYLVAKAATISAPFVNEQDEPIPILLVICICVVSLVLVQFAKDKSELDSMRIVENEQQKEEEEAPAKALFDNKLGGGQDT